MEEMFVGPFDSNDINFLLSLGNLFETRVKNYAKTKYSHCDYEKNHLIALLTENLTYCLAAFYLSGLPLKDERDLALDNLIEHLIELKDIDLPQIKKDCDEQEYH